MSRLSSSTPALHAAPLARGAEPPRGAESAPVDGPIDFDRAPVGARPAAPGALVGRVAAIDDSGRAWVESPALPGECVPARATLAAGALAIDAQVVLAFENADPRLPIVLGVLEAPGAPPRAELLVRRDDERLVLSADQEIVLECGEASITLTKAGKVVIRGAYVVTRSTGVNRIKGASVQIN